MRAQRKNTGVEVDLVDVDREIPDRIDIGAVTQVRREEEMVLAAAADEDVIAIAAIEPIRCASTREAVIAPAAENKP